MSSPGPRRQAREAALQVLFAADAQGQLGPGEIKRVFDEISVEFALPRRARERAEAICAGVAEQLPNIDGAIGDASEHWRVERLATVDRAVLRIAVFELLCEGTTPAEVVIDEAVEIARRFAQDTSPAFVNGVLDALWRRERGESK